MNWFITAFLAVLTAVSVMALGAFLMRSALLNWVVDRALVRALKDPYSKNLWDVVIGMTRIPPTILMELELRAEFDKPLERPLGTIRFLPDFAGVAFNPAQLNKPPLGPQAPVDLTTVIGAKCQRPLRLEMPILVSGMGFGVSLSKPFVVGVARGASQAGTAYNAGSGPVLDEILQDTKHLILQYTGGAWNREYDILAQADMLEIRYGHAGRAAIGRVIPAAELPPEARQLMGVSENGQALFEAPLPGAATPAELSRLVPTLRKLINGGPVGVKLFATQDIEQELAAVLAAGVDVIAIDGAQGGTHAGPPIIADDFGIPTVHALHRAVKFLEGNGARKDVTLIMGGGLRTPGEFLKVLALGADAVYVGTAVMMSGTHGQISKSVPFEPVTQICWATGDRADMFDPNKGAQTVTNFLKACAGELAQAARALGKPSLKEINRDDLIARDPQTATVLGLPPSWLPGGGASSSQSASPQSASPQPGPWEPPQPQRGGAASPQPASPQPASQQPASPQPPPWEPPKPQRGGSASPQPPPWEPPKPQKGGSASPQPPPWQPPQRNQPTGNGWAH